MSEGLVEFFDRTGRSALRFDGKCLCSSVDAAKEADAWVRRLTPQLRGMSRLIVLGAGAGHHLAQLASVFSPAKILVIEKMHECVSFCKEAHALAMTEVQFLVPKSSVGIFDERGIKEFLSHAYTVARFFPATAADSQFYDEVEELLSGRTVAAFERLLEIRPQVKDLFRDRPGVSALRGNAKKLISIKNLMGVLNIQNSHPDSLLLHALGELIS